MAKDVNSDQLKEKFRPQDEALEREVVAALEGVSLDDLYATDKPEVGTRQQQQAASRGGQRRGRIVSIGKDDVFVDLGGKSQGVVPITQFEDVEPVIGAEMDFHVDRYDEREGVLVLTR